MGDKARIGVVGTGYIAKGLVMALEGQPDILPSRVLTRTNIKKRSDFPRPELLTNSPQELINKSDLVVECSGDVIHATEVIDKVMAAQLPVVTMDAELQVTTGSYLAKRGFITEAEGDQPGCLATLKEDVLQMGFKPLVYGNIKGFLNHSPTVEEMEFWAEKQSISLDKVTSFTDGTKIQIEQALVANGLGAGIAVPGLLGIASEDVNTGAEALAEQAKAFSYPISDYILSPKSPPGVFIVAENDERQKLYLRNYKMGEGPYYVLAISVAAVAKKPLEPGNVIRQGIGSFDVRGIAVRIKDSPTHVPIGLLSNAVVKRHIEPEQQISFDDVELPDSLALRAWQEIKQNLIQAS